MDQKSIKSKPKKERCYHCNTRLTHIKWDCKCSTKKFCSKCRLPENHKCAYDFTNEENKLSLKESLVKVVHEKIIRI